MGIRVIGDDRRIQVGIEPIEAGGSDEGRSQPATNFRPVGEELRIDVNDNGDESDVSEPSGFTDPATIAGSGDSDAPFGRTATGRRRNRPVGSGKRGSAPARNTSKTTDSVAAMLFTIHTVAGSILKMDALKLEKQQCEELATAVLEVTELYEVPLLNEKGMAWANLAATMAKVYVFDASKNKAAPTLVRSDQPKPVSAMPSFMRG